MIGPVLQHYGHFMQRILATLAPVVFLFFLRRTLNPADGPQSGQVAAAQLAAIRFLSERLAGGYISDEAVGLIFAVMLLLAGVMGFVLHLVLQDKGFGPWLNGLLCFFGAACTDIVFVMFAPRAYVANPSALLMISSVGAICLLLLVAVIKAALLARFDDFASGANPLGVARKKGVPPSRISAVTRRY
jgi:hypothetical protein